MDKEHISVITDREELYDKCENMEQLYDKYYLPLLDIHYRKVYELQQENQQLKIQVSSREEVANKYKEVIDKAIEYIEKDYYSKNTTDIDSIILSNDKLLKIRKILKCDKHLKGGE